MSYSFYVRNINHLLPLSLLEGLSEQRLILQESDMEEASVFPEGIFHFALENESTRGVEVQLLREEFSVRIVTAASHEDCRAALELCRRVASLVKQPIESEEGNRFEHDDRSVYNDDWIAEHSDQNVKILLSMAKRESSPLHLPGPQESFYLDAKMATDFERSDDAPRALFDSMRKIQWRDGGKYYSSLGLALESKKGETATLHAFGPGVAYLFSYVDLLSIETDAKSPCLIPFDALFQISHARVTRPDAGHVFVEAIGDEDWPGFLEQARAHELSDPFEKQRARKPVRDSFWKRLWRK